MTDTTLSPKPRRAWLTAALPLIVFLGLAVWLGIPLLTGDDPRAIPSALIDQPAPEFTLPGLDGRPEGRDGTGLATEQITGTGDVLLVNFFASWCLPCLAEHPLITRLSETDGLVVHGISSRDQPGDTRAWLTRHGDPFDRVGVDLGGRAGIDWGVTGVPETFLLDAQGRIRWRHQGPLTPDLVNGELTDLIVALRGGA